MSSLYLFTNLKMGTIERINKKKKQPVRITINYKKKD